MADTEFPTAAGLFVTDRRLHLTGRVVRSGLNTHVQGVGFVSDAVLIEYRTVRGLHRSFCRPSDLRIAGRAS